ncbi:hypothetical protein Bpfe_030833 [Biomphalaria pfeifferi]|uniref:Uncharacterized protein n=1 Tax=Biomphalaria pfeifferi TaxID=112525 RepID=A0AAD8ANY6_BIOPF|nr:hypothetical protein Bpfe_030833 [Biomphalaria pfeifferi]
MKQDHIQNPPFRNMLIPQGGGKGKEGELKLDQLSVCSSGTEMQMVKKKPLLPPPPPQVSGQCLPGIKTMVRSCHF